MIEIDTITVAPQQTPPTSTPVVPEPSTPVNTAVPRVYGWVPQVPDPRDKVLALDKDISKQLPKAFDLRPKFPDLYNQLQLGSCTGNAWTSVFWYNQVNQGYTHFPQFSRLFLYYFERSIDGTVDQDAGSSIRSGVKALARYGVPFESDWPYDVSRFKEQPPQVIMDKAQKFKAVMYEAVPQKLVNLKTALAAGRPVVFGFTVFESFEQDIVSVNGLVPMPKPGEQELGKHAVVAVGYDDGRQVFIIRNSWGSNWGDGGYFYMPYAYILNKDLASDFWVVTWESE